MTDVGALRVVLDSTGMGLSEMRFLLHLGQAGLDQFLQPKKGQIDLVS